MSAEDGISPTSSPMICSYVMNVVDTTLETTMKCPKCKNVTDQSGIEVEVEEELSEMVTETRRYWICSECGNIETKVVKHD